MINPKWEHPILLLWTFTCLVLELVDAEKIRNFGDFVNTMLSIVLAGLIYYSIGLVIVILASGIYTIAKHAKESLTS